MGHFSASLNRDDSGWVLTLVGELGNETKLPPVLLKDEPLCIDMDKVLFINSYGITLWKTWTNAHLFLPKIILKNVPTVFIRQLQAISFLIPQNAEIDSFYVPFFSEEEEELKLVLLKRGVDFEKELFLKLPTVSDSKNNLMVPDVDERKYFSFLRIN